MILEELASDIVLDHAYAWLCERRKKFPENADVWTFRHRWPQEKARLRAELLAGRYRFEPQDRIALEEDGEVDVWRARDQLVLKALALVLTTYLPVSPCCTHLKGGGGSKWCVRQVRARLAEYAFVCRTDVKDYYASIDQEHLFAELVRTLPDRRVAPLLWQYLRRVSERGGLFWEFRRGIAFGCPLSPLMAAFHLHTLDCRMQALAVFYLRFMDDVIVLARTRWGLRRAVQLLNAELIARGLEKHPAKTFIGRIAKGFDYLGYHFSPSGLRVSAKTLAQFRERATRLYEQNGGGPNAVTAVWGYVNRFTSWACAAVGEVGFMAGADGHFECDDPGPVVPFPGARTYLARGLWLASWS